MNLKVRHAVPADMERMAEIFALARERMRLGGNPTQWGNDRPPVSAVENDIAAGNSYVVEDENGTVQGTFAFIIGKDPTYSYIENGAWPDDDSEYGTIHRVASSGACGGIFDAAVSYCLGVISHLRIDTHENNKPMRHLCESRGFVQCGIIYVDDGSPRIAFDMHKK